MNSCLLGNVTLTVSNQIYRPLGQGGRHGHCESGSEYVIFT